MDELEAIVNASNQPAAEEAPPAQDTPAQASETPAKEAPPKAPAPRQEPPNGLKVLLEKEKSIREQEARLKAYEEEVNEYRKARELARSNPEALLEKLGVQIPGKEKAPDDPVKQMADKLAQLEAFVAQQREREEKTQKQQAEEAARSSMKEWLGSVDDFHAIKGVGAEDLVFDYIKQQYEQTGDVLGEEEAAREVEARLTELAEKLFPLLQAKQQANPPKGTQPKTITGAHVALGGDPDLSKMSDDEALEYLVRNLG